MVVRDSINSIKVPMKKVKKKKTNNQKKFHGKLKENLR